MIEIGKEFTKQSKISIEYSMKGGHNYQRLDDQSHHSERDVEENQPSLSHSSLFNETNHSSMVELPTFSSFINPLMGYSTVNQIDDESQHISTHASQKEGESSSFSANPNSTTPTVSNTNNGITIKVHCKEQQHEIKITTLQITILQFKEQLVSIVNIPIIRQRLIFNGKLLQPNDKYLSDFNVTHLSSIHLFPLPEATTINLNPSSSSSNAVPLATNAYRTTSIPSSTNPSNMTTEASLLLHSNEEIHRYGREVKMWCSILLIASAFALFNNLSYVLTSDDSLIKSDLDGLVFVMDTVSNLVIGMLT